MPVVAIANRAHHSGRAYFNPTPPPLINVSPSSLTYSATAGGSNPASQTVTVTNGGGGSFAGLTLSGVTYQQGSGWVTTLSLAGSVVTVGLTTGALTAGTYGASFTISDASAGNSPVTITISFAVAASGGTYALDRWTLPVGVTRNTSTGNADGSPFSLTYALGAGTIRQCSNASDVTTALLNCADGDVVKVKAGVTYGGPFNLRNRGGTQSASAANPVYIVCCDAGFNVAIPVSSGTRATLAHTASLAHFTNTNTVTNSRAITTSAGATGYRLVGLWITPAQSGTSGAAAESNLVFIGSHDPSTQANEATYIGFDRCVVEPNGSTMCRVLMRADGQNIGAIDSSFVGAVMSNADESKAILPLNSSGPLYFENCRIQAAGINILFGGGTTTIQDAVPSDCYFHKCEFDKPASMKGQGYSCKNLFESKFSRRVLMDSCVYHGNFQEGQDGNSFRMTSTWSPAGNLYWGVGAQAAPYYRSVASVSGNTITIASQSWTTDQFANWWIMLCPNRHNGSGAGDRYQVLTNNTTGTLTLASTPTGAATGWITLLCSQKPHLTETRDFTMRWCLGYDLSSLFKIDGVQAGDGSGMGLRHTQRVEVRDCLFYHLNQGVWTCSTPHTCSGGDSSADNVVFEHVTARWTGDPNDSWAMQTPYSQFVVKNCITHNGTYGVIASGFAEGKATMDAQGVNIATGAIDYTFDHNAVIGGFNGGNYANLHGAPTNWMQLTATTAAEGANTIRFVGDTTTAANCALGAGSKYLAGGSRQATDSLDVGAPVSEIITRTTGVV